MLPEFLVFDRSLLMQRRSNIISNLAKADFLIKYSLQDIIERLSEVSREFPLVLNLSSRSGYGYKELIAKPSIKKVIDSDISFNFIKKNSNQFKIVMDEENLAFADNKFDLIVSVLGLHSVNDLPGCFIQLKNCLKPNGILIASIFGEDNLFELRKTLMETEIQCFGGVSPRLMPSIGLKQLGSLLQRAGFNMPVVDKDRVQVIYSNPMDLLYDLKNMGENNIMLNRNKKYLGKEFWKKFANNYIANFSKDQTSVVANFEILTLTAVK